MIYQGNFRFRSLRYQLSRREIFFNENISSFILVPLEWTVPHSIMMTNPLRMNPRYRTTDSHAPYIVPTNKYSLWYDSYAVLPQFLNKFSQEITCFRFRHSWINKYPDKIYEYSWQPVEWVGTYFCHFSKLNIFGVYLDSCLPTWTSRISSEQ